MIIGDSVTHGGHAFHPSIVEPPISIEDDEKQDEEDGLSMDPSTAQHLVVSALTTALHFHPSPQHLHSLTNSMSLMT